MPANVASWTKEALGKSLTPQQFLNDAQAQIKTIDFKLNQYFQGELGKGFDIDTAVRRVASTWYSGQPNLYNDTRPQTYGAGSYPSIDSYTTELKADSSPEALASAKVGEAAKTELQGSLTNLEANLEKIKAIQDDSADLEEKYTQFVEYQNELKIHQEQLNKRSLLNNQKLAYAEQRGILEAQRKLKLKAEELRLAIAIA
ncbi:MAG: hypothetical protein QNJ55_33530 [Xenococcus sp. MO_188.B8]|nr:hypothetical protein [Xenococcus sp. MO_188.B8]